MSAAGFLSALTHMAGRLLATAWPYALNTPAVRHGALVVVGVAIGLFAVRPVRPS